MTDTAYSKSHFGSMQLKTDNTTNTISIIANHVTNPNDKAIGVYRWVDALHDFESYLKKPLNTLLRKQYGIGTQKVQHEFYKLINGSEYTFSKTTSSIKDLHENLDHQEILLEDSEGITEIHYPNTKNNDTTFTYNLPKLLETYNINDLPTTSILEEYPEGDLLLYIIGDKNQFHDKASDIKTFLGINDDTDTYSKDSANISTETFQKIFMPTGSTDTIYDYAFFSEILDPSSEQTDIITTNNVNISMLYCMIDETPVYITIQKRIGDKETWYYAFHTSTSTPTSFESVNFNVRSTGAHPAPNIDTAVYFIQNEIQNKKFSALLNDINTIVKRMTNKSKKNIMSKNPLDYSITKKEAENILNFGKFTDFYKHLIATFKKDINKTNLTPEQITTIIIAFKTIGDQMYLYDSILLTKHDLTKPDRQPWMITGDTFLKDYSIYTKSTNIMCPTKYGESGNRKLTVYIKPQAQLTPEQIALRDKLLSEKKAKLEAEKAIREKEYYENKQTPLPDFNCNIIVSFIDIIQKAEPTSTSTGRNITHFDSNPITNIHGMTLIFLYNAIIHVFLTCQKLYSIKNWLDKTVYISKFKEYDSEKQKAYLYDYKIRLGSYNENVTFINTIQTNDILSFINSVLNNVTNSFTGITNISNPINIIQNTFYKNSTNHSFDIINTDIINTLKQLHTHKNASTQLLKSFKDFQRERPTMKYNLERIITNQLDDLIIHTGAGFIPTKQSEIIQMLKEDIDEFLSHQLAPSQLYLNGLGTLLDKTNTHQMKIDNEDKSQQLKGKKAYPYLHEKKFELLRNISASYETALDLGYDNDIELLGKQQYTSTPIAYKQLSTVTSNVVPVALPPLPPTIAPTTPSQSTPNKTKRKRVIEQEIGEPYTKYLKTGISVGAGKKTKRIKKRRTHKKQDNNKTKRRKSKRHNKK